MSRGRKRLSQAREAALKTKAVRLLLDAAKLSGQPISGEHQKKLRHWLDGLLAGLPSPLPVKARLVGDDARLTLFLDLPTGDGAPRGAYFYCADLETVDHSTPQAWLADARGARLVIPASPYARSPAARLRGVLRVEYPAPVYWSLDLPVQKQTLQGDPR